MFFVLFYNLKEGKDKSSEFLFFLGNIVRINVSVSINNELLTDWNHKGCSTGRCTVSDFF